MGVGLTRGRCRRQQRVERGRARGRSGAPRGAARARRRAAAPRRRRHLLPHGMGERLPPLATSATPHRLGRSHDRRPHTCISISTLLISIPRLLL